jgi:putative SOS response-associated peptidase YedK
MCGRTAFTATIDDVVEQFAVERHFASLAPRFNIAPGYGGVGAPSIVRIARDGKRELAMARWWLIPRWWKKSLKELPAAFNARAEDIARKPFFRDALVTRRCVMPATAWYEFCGACGHKESFAFQLPGRQLFGFAGIWDSWVNPEDGEVIDSFAIATTTANRPRRATTLECP